MNITGARTGDAMNLNFGVETAHVRDTTAPFLPKPLFGLRLREVSSTVRRLPMGTAYW